MQTWPCGKNIGVVRMTRRKAKDAAAKKPPRTPKPGAAAKKAAVSDAAAAEAAPAVTLPRRKIVWQRHIDLLPVVWTVCDTDPFL